jgi:hypothetical protein
MSERAFERHSGLLDLEMVKEQQVHVVGCGAIGKPVALALAGLGVGEMSLWDDDVVSEENVGPQAWPQRKIGEPKVNVLDRMIHELNPGVLLQRYEDRITEETSSPFGGDVVMCCVDSLAARKEVWNWWRDAESMREPSLWVDGRMAAEVWQMFAVPMDRPDRFKKYEESLDTQGVYRAPCTRKATSYCALTVAGCMVSAVSQWWQGRTPPYTVDMNMRTFELDVE